MTILDRVSASSRSLVQDIVDKEPINYMEAGLFYGIISNGRYNVATLTILYNHAQEPDLRELIKEAIDNLTEKTIKVSENFLKDDGSELPNVHYPKRTLESKLDIPSNARFTDMEIAMVLVNMHNISQMALLTAISQSYHLDISIELTKQLNNALDWSYRLQQLMLQKKWLPKVAKVLH